MRKEIKSAVLVISLGLFLPSLASAQDKETAIDRVLTAYNVPALEKARTIRIEQDNKVEFPDHEYGPEFQHFSHQKRHHILDLKNERGSSEFLSHIGNSNYHGRSLLKDGKAIFIDYPAGNYQDNGETTFLAEYGPVIRSTDTLLAIWLGRTAETARYKGEQNWLGLIHDVVEIDFPSSPPLQIFVRRKDGAITKMKRSLPSGLAVTYVFQRHQKQDGSLIARELELYADDERIDFSYNRKIDINDRKDRKAFILESGISEEPARLDESEMSVKEITVNSSAPAAHHVGLGETYSTFLQTGDFITAFGGSEGFADRLKAYRDETGINSPLRYVIIPDFHAEELGGAAEAVTAGATLLTTEDGAAALSETIVDTSKMEIITSERSISGLTLYPMSTDHTKHVIAGYFEPQNAALQSGHYGSPYADAPFYAKYVGVTLYNGFPQEVQNTAKLLVTAQSQKPEKWSDFENAVANHNPLPCQRNRPICRS